MKRFIYTLLPMMLALIMCQSPAEEQGKPVEKSATASPGQALLDSTIHFHDPENKWPGLDMKVTQESRMLREEDDTTAVRTRHITLDNTKSYFSLEQNYNGHTLRRVVAGDTLCMSEWEKSDLTSEDSTSAGLTCERAITMRNYFRYLLGLPMVLRDDGTIVKEETGNEELFGQTYRTLTVNYEGDEPEWTFFIDTRDYRMAAARFVKPDSSGEYIVFKGAEEQHGIKHSQSFEWYYLDKKPLAKESYTFK